MAIFVRYCYFFEILLFSEAAIAADWKWGVRGGEAPPPGGAKKEPGGPKRHPKAPKRHPKGSTKVLKVL